MLYLNCIESIFPTLSFLSFKCSQHVMKFAELTQEVLITKSEEKIRFDGGLTPGRRRNELEQAEEAAQTGIGCMLSCEYVLQEYLNVFRHMQHGLPIES